MSDEALQPETPDVEKAIADPDLIPDASTATYEVKNEQWRQSEHDSLAAEPALPQNPATGYAQIQSGQAPDEHIAKFQQFIISARSKVTSWTHNVHTHLQEQFGSSGLNSTDPIWLLGKSFTLSDVSKAEGNDEGASGSGTRPADDKVTLNSRHFGPNAIHTTGVEGFQANWDQLRRITYRSDFPAMYRKLEDSDSFVKLTSDAGWGCMIRVGQMMLLTALKKHILHYPIPGSDSILANTDYDYQMRELKLIDLFLDQPDFEKHPFSIFAFIKISGGWIAHPHADADRLALESKLTTFRKLPGDWFGPTTVSYALQELIHANGLFHENLAIYVNTEGAFLFSFLFCSSANVLHCQAQEPTLPGTFSAIGSPEL